MGGPRRGAGRKHDFDGVSSDADKEAMTGFMANNMDDVPVKTLRCTICSQFLIGAGRRDEIVCR